MSMFDTSILVTHLAKNVIKFREWNGDRARQFSAECELIAIANRIIALRARELTLKIAREVDDMQSSRYGV